MKIIVKNYSGKIEDVQEEVTVSVPEEADVTTEKKWLADIIGDSYMQWLNHEKKFFVFLKAGCGSGKTHFLLKVFMPYIIEKEKRMIILLPRKSLRRKFLMDLVDMMCEKRIEREKLHKYITVMSYQELEKRRMHGMPVPSADICVVEEAAYFLDDAEFNARTHVSFDWLIGEGCAPLNIWISGTADEVFDEVKARLVLQPSSIRSGITEIVNAHENMYIEYDTERDYSWFDVKYLKENFEIYDLVKLHPDEKWLFFYDSKAKGQADLEKLIENGCSAVFLNAENVETEGSEIVNSIASIDKFNQQILLTTAVIEAGNDFKEMALKNVVVFNSSRSSFIQMVSRRRKQSDEDRITVYIPKRDSKYFEDRLKKTVERLNIYAESVFEDIFDTADIVRIMLDKKVYNAELFDFCALDIDKLRISDWTLKALLMKRDFYKKMCHELCKDEHAFVKKQLSWLGLDTTFDESNYVSAMIAEDAKKEIVARMKAFAEAEEKYDSKQAGDLVKELTKLVGTVDSQYVKGGMAMPKFTEFCKVYNLGCGCEKMIIAKKTYYRFWVNGEETLECEKLD